MLEDGGCVGGEISWEIGCDCNHNYHYTDGSNDMAKAANRRAHDEGMIFLSI